MNSELQNHQFLINLGTALGLAVGTYIIYKFWDQIMQWVRSTLLPWIRRSKFSFLSQYMENAYTSLEDASVVVKEKAFQAWGLIREKIFFQNVTIRREGLSYVRQLTSYATLDPYVEEPDIEVITTQKEKMDINELPSDVAQALKQNGFFERNITDDRDQEFLAHGFS